MPVWQLPRPPSKDEPIMLKNVPIMLCCTAPKIFLLCSTKFNAPIMLKLCSLNVTLIAKTNHLDCFKYAWVVCQVIVISLQNGVYQPYACMYELIHTFCRDITIIYPVTIAICYDS